MDSFLKNVTSSITKTETTEATQTQTTSTTQTPNPETPPPSTTELLSSAKVVADAAQAKFSNQEFDQTKAAGAAADLLNAASHYGKLEEDQGVGKYLDKAEDYLNQYSHKTTTTATTTTAASDTAPAAGGHPEGDSGSGVGDYMKMAGDFLKKN